MAFPMAALQWGGPRKIFGICLLGTLLVGCGQTYRASSADQIKAFEEMNPIETQEHLDQYRDVPISSVYRVVPGDVLQITIPCVLSVITSLKSGNSEEQNSFRTRVDQDGTVALPVIGHLNVAGKSLTEIGTRVIHSYYPRYLKEVPAVFVEVVDHHRSRVTITGNVANPNVYWLPKDQMSLLSLMAMAGGLREASPGVIRIKRRDTGIGGEPLVYGNQSYTVAPRAKKRGEVQDEIRIPIIGIENKFEDVELEEGDQVIVERIQLPLITILGLVGSPGNYPYPQGTEYNLIQALGLAGGLDMVSEPTYAIIYRFGTDGDFHHIIVPLKGDESLLTPVAANQSVRPGDIVDVAPTARTRTTAFLKETFRITIGAYVSVRDFLF